MHIINARKVGWKPGGLEGEVGGAHGMSGRVARAARQGARVVGSLG